MRLLLGALAERRRYFVLLLARVETPALALVCATVTGAGVGVRGIVVVGVTVTIGAAEVGAREGVETWVVVVPVLVLLAITSTGWSRDGVGEGFAARAGAALLRIAWALLRLPEEGYTVARRSQVESR